jgi:hypothetical protein
MTLNLMQRLSSLSVFCGVRAAQSLVFCEMLCPFVLFLLAIVLSVFLQLLINYLVGIFKLFLKYVKYFGISLNFLFFEFTVVTE